MVDVTSMPIDRATRGPWAPWSLVRQHRAMLAALAIRLLWWGALALWLGAARELFAGAAIDVAATMRTFSVGAAMCGIAVVGTGATRIRVMSWALGSLHGCSAVVLWLAAN